MEGFEVGKPHSYQSFKIERVGRNRRKSVLQRAQTLLLLLCWEGVTSLTGLWLGPKGERRSESQIFLRGSTKRPEETLMQIFCRPYSNWTVERRHGRALLRNVSVKAQLSDERRKVQVKHGRGEETRKLTVGSKRNLLARLYTADWVTVRSKKLDEQTQA